ncbi:bifunctional diguanylate cyclase/phosphodiesterase [Poseidonibacter lekithochrous]|uniref:bifunctional diguanylate cyclase/phosphodiesterase n=1 Tax=Poseidonibacter lekithochrous TaxID=1904463 RepID=UPI0008FC251B|nr:bifunctional diguanylate cyclase/phosphodiesterase [Poseidonibacter lekithochrous]QKJ22560.1 PAS sensor-containing diguanylate cyclase/phosphodiesterase [Poseidonibacter lekithochrous]
MKFDEIFSDTQILEYFNFGICILDPDLKVQYWNSWISFFTKISPNEIKGQNLEEFFPNINIKKLKRQIVAAISIDSATYYTSKDGYIFPIELDEITNPIYKYMQQQITIFPISDNYVLLSIADQTSLKEANKKIKEFTQIIERKRKLLKDKLTGLENRNKLLLDLDIDENKQLALFNIKGFNEINDFFGYELGDKYLIFIANKFLEFTKDLDIDIFKLTADEYVLYSANNKTYTNDEFIEITQNILKDLENQYFFNDSQRLAIYLSVGVSFYQDKILETADIAMKKSKQKKELIVYDDSINREKEIQEKLKWFEVLEEAISSNKIKTFFQPIFNMQTKEIEKYETLVRLIDKNDKVISPYFFLDISKQAKLYNEITATVINQSFEKFKDNDYEFSINFSVEDIEHEPTVNLLVSKLQEYPSIANRLVIELLEDEGIENFEMINEFILKLRAFGVKFAIDDFGTGYSNFSYLLKLDIDYLKIDASLIKNINLDTNSKKIVETLVEFSKKIGAKTIAEFVHNKEVFDDISDIDINYAQGYYIDEPRANIGSKPLWK